MNDTVRRMCAARVARVVSVTSWCGWLVVAACNAEPSLAVSVHHPAGFAVNQTMVTVYFSDTIKCQDIEFGDRTDAELAAIAVDEVDATGGGQIDVSRLGSKAIVARGYDAQHRFVTAGCMDVGDVTGATHVAIDTQPTASVAIDPGQPDQPLAQRMILVNMTDTGGKQLDGTVSWQLTGPYGAPSQTASAGMPTRNGNVKFQVTDLGVPGPEGLRIRAPWATAPLPLVTGFDLSHQTMISLGSGGGLADPPSCDVRRHAGKPATLVCLTPSSLGHRNAIEIAWQVDHYATTALPALPGDNQFAVFVDHDGSADEPVYVLSANTAGVGSWYKLGGGTTAMAFGDALQNVVYIPKCADGATQPLVGVQTGPALGMANQVRFFTPAGSPLTAATSGEVFSGGCIHDVDKKEHQGVVVAGSTGDAALELIAPGTGMAMPITAAKFTGSGFVTIVTQGGTEKRFAGTRLQASGTVVFEAVLALQAGAYMLVERTELDAAAPPEKIIAGQLDGDGDTDLMWDMGVARRRVFQVSLAEQVDGAPLTAMTSGPGGISATTATPTDFAVADLNGKGIDEMVLFTVGSVAIYSPDE